MNVNQKDEGEFDKDSLCHPEIRTKPLLKPDRRSARLSESREVTSTLVAQVNKEYAVYYLLASLRSFLKSHEDSCFV